MHLGIQWCQPFCIYRTHSVFGIENLCSVLLFTKSVFNWWPESVFSIFLVHWVNDIHCFINKRLNRNIVCLCNEVILMVLSIIVCTRFSVKKIFVLQNQSVPKTIELTGHLGQWQALIYWPKPGFTGPNNWHNTMFTKFPHASRASGRALFTGPIGNWLANGIGPVLISQTAKYLLWFVFCILQPKSVFHGIAKFCSVFWSQNLYLNEKCSVFPFGRVGISGYYTQNRELS